MSIRNLAASLALLISFALFDGAQNARAADAELTPKIALNFTWQAAYMPLLYGQAKGYFKTATTAVYVWLDKPTLDVVSMAPLGGPNALSGKSITDIPSANTLYANQIR